MKGRERETIPAFLSVDVEPDAFQISCDNTQKWPGYGAIFDFSLWLRKELARASGMKPNFGWYYRMDPQIEEVCGRADVAMTAFPDRPNSGPPGKRRLFRRSRTSPTLVHGTATMGTRLR